MGLLHNKENENIDLAKQMLSLGLDIEQICEITKLSKEQIQQLLKEDF